MISWENSQNTDIALRTTKENAYFGAGFVWVAVLMLRKATLYTNETIAASVSLQHLSDIRWMMIHVKKLVLIIIF